MMRGLKPEELRAVCDPAALPFESTAELPALDGMIGQDRAMTATAFGIGMRWPGYSMFVVGAARTGRTSTMHRVLTRTAREEPTPSDHCYVFNFDDPYRPAALELPPGGEAADRGTDGRFPEGSFNAAVEAALAANVDRLKQLRGD